MYKIQASHNGNNSVLSLSTFLWSNAHVDHVHDGFILLLQSTCTTRKLQCFSFLCKLGLLLFLTSQEFPSLYMKGKTKWILLEVVKWRYRANGLFHSRQYSSSPDLLQTSALQSLSTRQFPYYSAIVTMTMYCKKLVFLLITHILVIFFSGIKSYLGLTTS